MYATVPPRRESLHPFAFKSNHGLHRFEHRSGFLLHASLDFSFGRDRGSQLGVLVGKNSGQSARGQLSVNQSFLQSLQRRLTGEQITPADQQLLWILGAGDEYFVERFEFLQLELGGLQFASGFLECAAIGAVSRNRIVQVSKFAEVGPEGDFDFVQARRRLIQVLLGEVSGVVQFRDHAIGSNATDLSQLFGEIVEHARQNAVARVGFSL